MIGWELLGLPRTTAVRAAHPARTVARPRAIGHTAAMTDRHPARLEGEHLQRLASATDTPAAPPAPSATTPAPNPASAATATTPAPPATTPTPNPAPPTTTPTPNPAPTATATTPAPPATTPTPTSAATATTPASPTPAPPAPAATSAKSRLRASLRADRRARAAATDEGERARTARALSRRVREHLATHAPDGRAGLCVAAFEALPTEVPTNVLLAELVADGCAVLVPVLRPDKDLDWRAWQPSTTSPAPCAAPARPSDVRESPADELGLLGLDAVAQCDVVLVPALAVDRGGRRLGQGGGSYDRALPRRRAGVPVIALVADAEFVDGPLPVADHDEPVDGVVTPGLGYRALPEHT